ncbi:MAG: metallophosphoesterase family protein [Chloroflexota bacterium]|nr:metallophosphoesterase family protein [Chloroflexota bacterium]MDE2899214.1 metallophosphoesterase family protein [Chloroflexota bacterium]
MRIAVVTDIHGNRHALFAVLADLRRVGADQVVFGGDAALFGSRPRECWERVLDLGWRLVQGNTDRYIATLGPGLAAVGKPARRPTDFRATNVAWAAERLGPALVREMGAMPRQASIPSPAGTLLVVHGSPGDDETGWSRDDDEQTVAKVIGPTEATAVVSGHTHTAMIRHAGDVLAVNCGAVGRSHDGQPGLATYAVLDDSGGRWSAELRRVDYDHQGAYAEVQALGVPLSEDFANTLLTGVAPA